jgi:FkbM family methyltransferase
MKRQFRNRYLESAVILICSNPIEVFKFAVARIIGKQWPCRLNFRGFRLLVRPNSPDLRVVWSVLLGELEEAMRRARPRFNLIVDAGGYIGVTAVVFADRFPNTRVVVLEPAPENHRLASANCRHYANIEVLNYALAGKEGQVTLYDPGMGQWGFTTVQQPADAPAMKIVGTTVATVTIEALLRRYGCQGIDILKLDIEGGEYDLFQGCPEWVSRCGIIVAELHDRIRFGCSDVFREATTGRELVVGNGEKVVSVAPREAMPTAVAQDLRDRRSA